MKRSDLTPNVVRRLADDLRPIAARIQEIDGVCLRHPDDRVAYCGAMAAHNAAEALRLLDALVKRLDG